MNIVFIKYDIDLFSPTPCFWRGEMLFRALKKNSRNIVDLVSFTHFSENSTSVQKICSEAQILVFQAYPGIDLLNVTSYWKSRGKKIVVDIPLDIELLYFDNEDYGSQPKTLSSMYTNIQSNSNKTLNQIEKFRWGLHLADTILVSSFNQIEKWQSAAPVQVFPEYIDLDSLNNVTREQSNEFHIAIVSGCQPSNPISTDLIRIIEDSFPEVTIHIVNIENEQTQNNNFQSISAWRELPINYKLAIFVDEFPIRGIFYRNILEFLSLRIPFLLNADKGYKDLAKYGLIIENKENFRNQIINIFSQIKNDSTQNDEGYLFAIGQNIDDHINDILIYFSELIKKTG